MQTITKNNRHLDALASWLSGQTAPVNVEVLPYGAWLATVANDEGEMDTLIAFQAGAVGTEDHDDLIDAISARVYANPELGEWEPAPMGIDAITPDGFFYRYSRIRK